MGQHLTGRQVHTWMPSTICFIVMDGRQPSSYVNKLLSSGSHTCQQPDACLTSFRMDKHTVPLHGRAVSLPSPGKLGQQLQPHSVPGVDVGVVEVRCKTCTAPSRRQSEPAISLWLCNARPTLGGLEGYSVHRQAAVSRACAAIWHRQHGLPPTL